VFEEELSAVQALRNELEEGVERNSQMRVILERQMKDVDSSGTSFFCLKKHFLTDKNRYIMS